MFFTDENRGYVNLGDRYGGEYKHKKIRHSVVNEFTFRLNDGNCEIDTEDRLDSLFQSMVGKTISFKKLTAYTKKNARSKIYFKRPTGFEHATCCFCYLCLTGDAARFREDTTFKLFLRTHKEDYLP